MVSKQIIPQDDSQVKCSAEPCSAIVFRDGLCFDHFAAEEAALWDDQDAERLAALEGMGYIIFGDPMWEVLA